jgi:hypothetical protein
MLKSSLGVAFTLLLTGTSILLVMPLANLGSAMADEASDLFSQGLRDRTEWENWVLSLSGDERAGAEYWLRQRSLPNPGNCVGTAEFTKGCTEAQARLAKPDTLRKTQPAYRQGWYSYVATETLAPAPPSSPLFSQGLEDRTTWENWFSSLNGDEQAGAEYWAGQRSLDNPGNCLGSPEFTKGCNEAKARLTEPDVLRKSQPDYKAGWNSYVATAAPGPASAAQDKSRSSVASSHDLSTGAKDVPRSHPTQGQTMLVDNPNYYAGMEFDPAVLDKECSQAAGTAMETYCTHPALREQLQATTKLETDVWNQLDPAGRRALNTAAPRYKQSLTCATGDVECLANGLQSMNDYYHKWLPHPCTAETISARLGGPGEDDPAPCQMPSGQDNMMLGTFNMRINEARADCQLYSKMPDAPRSRECDFVTEAKAAVDPMLIARAITELDQHAKNCLWNGVVQAYMIDAPERCGLGSDPRAQAYARMLALGFN